LAEARGTLRLDFGTGGGLAGPMGNADQTMQGRNRTGIVSLLLVGLVATAALVFLASSGRPANLLRGVNAGYPEMYALLTEAYGNGRIDIPVTPSPALLALPNPYDPQANNGLRLHDAILYQEKYYLYYSPVPVFLLRIPLWKLTGAHVPQATAVALYSVLGLWASLGALLTLRRAWFSAAPEPVFVFLALGLAFMPSLMHMAGRPAVYEEAISCGYFFLMSGSLALAFAFARPGAWLRWGLAAAACFALAIGCRPNLTLLCPWLGLAWLWLVARRKENGLRKRALGFAALCTPFLAIGAGLAWLNWARFGSPLEFGWKWQLWGWKKPAYEAVFFSWRNIAPDFQLYFLTPFKGIEEFPYLTATTFRSLFRSPYTTGAEPLWGLLWSMPVTLGCSLWWALRGGWPRLLCPSAQQVWFLVLGISGMTALVFNLCYSSVAMRYMMDFAPLLQLAGCLAVFQVSNSSKAWRSPWVGIPLLVSGFATALVALAMGFTSYGHFKTQNPELYARLVSLFP